jgi:uncharacterized membrane protein
MTETTIPVSLYRRGILGVVLLGLAFAVALGMALVTGGRPALIAAGFVAGPLILAILILRAGRPLVVEDELPRSWSRVAFEFTRDVLAFFGAIQIVVLLLR